MALSGPVFFDTSVLLGGLVDLGPKSAAPMRLLDAVSEGRIPAPATAWHCCLELYAVTTRLPEEFRLTSAAARELIEEEVLARFELLDLPARQRSGFLTSSAAEGILGGRIYDAHLAAIALAGGARRLVTENLRHFGSLHRHAVRVSTAAELLTELTPPRQRQ